MKKLKKLAALFLCVVTLITAFSLSSLAAVELSKPEGFKITDITADSVSLTWLPSENASGYRLYSYSDGKWKNLKDTSATSITISGLHASNSYTFAIKSARKVLNKLYFSEKYSYVKFKTKSLVATTLSGSAGNNSVQLNWNKVNGAIGYAVYQYNGTKWNRLGVTKKLYGKVNNLKSATAYYFAVRALTDVNGSYVQGPASNYFKIKTLDENKVKVTCSAVSDSAVKLSWTKAPNSSGYRVYAYLNGQWKNVKTLSGQNTLSCTFKNLSSDTNYYFRVRAYKKSLNTVKWFEASEICKATTDPGVSDLYVQRVESLRKIFNSSQYTLSYTEVGNKYGNAKVTVAKNGNSYYLYTNVNERPYVLLNNTEGSYIILSENECYMSVPAILNKTFDVSATMESFMPKADWNARASLATFNSKKVVCESYTDLESSTTLKFYFKAGKFVGVEEYNGTKLVDKAVINSISKTSDPNLFVIPDGYTKIFFSYVGNLG